MGRVAAAHVMKMAVDVEVDFPELRGPARRLPRAGHEACVMVNRLEQRRLELPSGIEDAKASAAEAGWAGRRSHA